MIIATRTNMSETREETEFLKRKMLSDHLGEIEGKPFKFTKKMNDCGYGIDIILETISDVVEVRHGHWIPQWAGARLVKCSVCGYEYCDLIECTDYCGNCGAKMDGERSENATN